MEDHEREVLRLTRLLDGERREKEEEAKVFHKKVNIDRYWIVGDYGGWTYGKMRGRGGRYGGQGVGVRGRIRGDN